MIYKDKYNFWMFILNNKIWWLMIYNKWIIFLNKINIIIITNKIGNEEA